ncbi:hypothetical protein [Reinekea thalattae]|uniref:Uncharacterized protein n=1 Tax=Reinekea thalattae TaxID=2593301 RepID=A0A5C8Z1U9_9GAMM|nr:hypothetical protein [Reinekea thalattae]TXR52055.1 hypothetical protein FME95_11610 [Reinekea thalattae]
MGDQLSLLKKYVEQFISDQQVVIDGFDYWLFISAEDKARLELEKARLSAFKSVFEMIERLEEGQGLFDMYIFRELGI